MRLRWDRVRGGLTGLAVVVLAAGVVVAGAHGGYPTERPHLLSGSAWLASSGVGELTLLDGSSAEVAAQVRVADPGDRLGVVQQSATAYAVDGTDGTVRRIDGATFQVSPPATPVPGPIRRRWSYAVGPSRSPCRSTPPMPRSTTPAGCGYSTRQPVTSSGSSTARRIPAGGWRIPAGNSSWPTAPRWWST
ncbi:MAG: hypothetical protein E6G35_13905 [Actinobacteria bacterium]|nr:MAG: hypothetical protein E6G35_13905 [Actinomycetota bacterium]